MNIFKKVISILLALSVFLSVSAVLVSCNTTEAEQPHQHTFAQEWQMDENSHWHEATCEHATEKSELGNHTDYDYDDVCDACGYDMEVKIEGGSTSKIENYIVDVVDAAGNPVEGVKVILVSEDGHTSVKTTNARGRVSFSPESGNWVAALAEAVEGHSNTTDDRYEFTNRIAKITLN